MTNTTLVDVCSKVITFDFVEILHLQYLLADIKNEKSQLIFLST